MKVEDTFNIKGRGLVAWITDIPDFPRVLVGSFLHQGPRAWKITGIEMVRASRHGFGILLQPLEGTEDAPEKGEIKHGLVELEED